MDRRTFLAFIASYALPAASAEYRSRTLADRIIRQEWGATGQIILDTPHSTTATITLQALPLSPFWNNFGIGYKSTPASIYLSKSKRDQTDSLFAIAFGHPSSPFLRMEDRAMDDILDVMSISYPHKGEPRFRTSVSDHRQLAYKEALDTLAYRYQK